MFDESEWTTLGPLLRIGMERVKTFREEHGVELARVPFREAYAAVLLEHERVAGQADVRPEDIWHHRRADHGPACAACGRPLRTPAASQCAACGHRSTDILQPEMDPLLTDWLSELRRSPLVLGTDRGSGGVENLWTVSIPGERTDIDEQQLLDFLRTAQRVRFSQAAKCGVGPVVFYVWHDEMAGQLRFSMARGTVQDLPFQARVERVSELNVIVQSYVASQCRDGIPFDQLATAPFDLDDTEIDDHIVHVWALEAT